nr:response regulator [Rhodocyclus purpureus]
MTASGTPQRHSSELPLVLAVDDSPQNLLVVGTLLSPYYRVRTANSGRLALQLATQAPFPELILLDVMMPEMDGYEVIAQLKADPATREIPVIFLTAMDSTKDEEKGLALGAVDYITKPLHKEILLSRVRTHVGLFRSRQALERYSDELELRVEERTQELAQALRAEESASRARSVFLSNISHEIRTPLSVVIGLAELLKKDITQPEPMRKLDQLCANAEHLLALINDTLDLSKIESGQLTLERTEFCLASVVEKVMNSFAERAREKGLQLSADVAASISELHLLGDPLRLSQVLINLVGNAVKFTERGSVRLDIRRVSEEAGGVRLCFSVADSGCGISAADQAHIFERFLQLDASTTRRHGGSGLGLAISQHLVSMAGGSIRVDSQPGSGSTFSFELLLPRAAGNLPERTAAPARPLAATFAGKCILLAEDHPLSQEILVDMLRELGCIVDAVCDGVEAVERAQADRFDLILMDMQMPRMDGLAAARAIRALPVHHDTPIIALTANAFSEDRERCLAAGMNDHLGKPVKPATLAAALGQWLDAPTAPPPTN